MSAKTPVRRALVSAMAVSTSVGMMSAGAAEVADHPNWKVGDRWTFTETSSPPPKDQKWTREVVEVIPNGRLKVALGEAGKTAEFDAETNSLDARGPEYSWRRFKFPMSVGASWNYERKIGGDRPGSEQATWKVAAYEKVTVPAGTFDCFRVEGETFRSRESPNPKYSKGSTTATYWYCPSVKWAAKWESEDIAYFGAAPVHTSSVLVSFEQKP